MRQTGSIISICLLTLVAAGSAFADGGTLTRGDIPEDQPAIGEWRERQWITVRETASVTIPGTNEEVDVFVLKTAGDPRPVLSISAEVSPRVLCDVNGDGVFQAGEVNTGGNTYGFYRESFVFPYRARDSIDSIRVTLSIYVDDNSCSLIVDSIQEWYRGKVRIDGKEYEACLIFRSPFPKSDVVNEVVILDTDGDGIFHPFLDQWVAAEGIARFGDRLWVASTVFSGSGAEFTIRPYSGPTGRIEFTGEGVHRVHLLASAEGVPDLPNGKASPVCLPAREKPVFELPPGTCAIDEAWLEPEEGSPVLYRCKLPEGEEVKGATARLVTDATASIVVGGPLTDTISTQHGFLSREVYLHYGTCTNPAGLAFDAVVASGTWTRPDPSVPATYRFLAGGTWAGFSKPERGPSYEVRTAEGCLVASGNFDYG